MFNDFDTAEFKVGSKIRSVSRTITDGDFAAIVNNIWDTHPLHIDEEYMKTTIFGAIIGLVACYHGYNATGGAAGVGRAVNDTVVYAVLFFITANYFLTSALFGTIG